VESGKGIRENGENSPSRGAFMAAKTNSYRDTDIWRKACDLAEAMYQATQGFPKEEMYGLTSQIRRAAVSVPANISEGSGRIGPAEYRHFLSITLGSLAELGTLIELARRFRYVDENESSQLVSHIVEVERMTWGLHKSLAPDRQG
jgi:four helix bundle protein